MRQFSSNKNAHLTGGLSVANVLSRAGNLAVYRLVLLESCFLSICPISQNGERDKARLNDESERGLVLKGDGDFKKLQIGREFDPINDFVPDLRKICEFSEA